MAEAAAKERLTTIKDTRTNEELRSHAVEALTDKQLAVLKKQFQMIDKDGSGIVTKSELRIALKELGVYTTERGLDRGVVDMIQLVDKDGSDSIDLQEFIAMMAMSMNNHLSEDELRLSFDAFDADGSGVVSFDELRGAFQSLGKDMMSDAEVESMMKMFDTDGDGMMDFGEFKRVMHLLMK